jgi:Flp pilus assembly protein TadD
MERKTSQCYGCASARRLEERMKKMDSAEANAVMFTMRGVSATNQNDWPAAREDFLQAYSLDPVSAFSLNNRGYVAEMDGDLETAQFFYDKARKAGDSNIRVGLASPAFSRRARSYLRWLQIATIRWMENLTNTVRIVTGKQVRLN